jgi:trigger factor
MATNLETLGTLERRLTMAVPAADIEQEVSKRLNQLSRTIRMAGFRPGKVPMKLVSQQYGPQVRSEVVGDAVQKVFTEAVTENKLRVAGYPRIERKDGDAEPAAGGELAFTATFEVYPEVTLGDLKAKAIERPVVTVGDAEVDKTVEILRRQRQTYEPVERAAQKDDQVTIDFDGSVDDVPFAGGKGGDLPVVLGQGRMVAGFEDALTGMKAGEEKTFPVTFPEDYHGKDVAGKTASFKVAVKSVAGPKLPELDAEFAKALGVADGDTTRMRAEVRANVEKEVNKRLENETKNRVMQALLDATPLELPKSLVEMETQRVVQTARADLEARGMKLEQLPINPEMFETQARRRVSLGLIVGKLVEDNSLAPKPEQVRALVNDYAESYEQPAEVVKWVYSDAQRLAEFEGMAVEANVVQWVLANAKVDEKPMAFDELMGNAA